MNSKHIKYKTVLLLLFCISCTSLFAQKNPCNTDVKNIDYTKEKNDTTITMPNGTELTFNRCEYFDIRDCLEVKEIRTLDDVIQSGYNTIDNNGNVLLTCGMLKLNFKAGDCTQPCLTVPVKVRIPILANRCLGGIDVDRLYRANSNGKWEKMQDESKVVIGANGKKYFEFYTKCGGGYNCDNKMSTVKVKFKSKKIKTLFSLNASAHCPIINLNYSTSRRKNIIYALLPCINPDSLLIKVEGLDAVGNRVFLSKPLSSFQSKNTCSKCNPISKKVVRNILGIFKTRERFVYKKYIID